MLNERIFHFLKVSITVYIFYTLIYAVWSYLQVLDLANLNDLCSEVWLIYCTSAQQYQRLSLRNSFSYAQSKLRIESQLSIDHKRQLSDLIIDNSGTIQSSYDQIDTLLN